MILPVATYLERDESIQDKSGTAPGFYMRNKVVEPIAIQWVDMSYLESLVRRLGVDQDYSWNTVAEYRMQQAKGNAELIAALEKMGM